MNAQAPAGARARALNAALLLAAGVLYLLYARRLFGFTPDDTFIFFRYVQNWAEGHGLVYNPGERVAGFTSPLWVAWLAGLHTLGAPLLEGAKISGLILGLLAIVVCTLIATEARRSFSGGVRLWVAPLLLVSFLDLPHWAVSGMDTALFTLLAGASVFAYLRSWRQPGWLVAAALGLALTTLARPDGAVFAVVIAVAELWRARGRPTARHAAAAACYALPVAAFVGWHAAYYDDALPNTYYAKHLPLRGAIARGQSNLRGFLHYSNGAAACLLAGLALVGGMNDAVLLLASLVGAYLLYVLAYGGDWWNVSESFRFFVPILPLLAVLMAEGLHVLWQLVVPRLTSTPQRAIAGLAGAAFLVVLLTPTGIGARSDETIAGDRELASFLNGVAEPDDVLAVTDIGQFGFYSDLVILDMAGLVDRTIARELARTRRDASAISETTPLVDYVFARNPRFVILKGRFTEYGFEMSRDVFTYELHADPRFAERYVHVPSPGRPPYELFVRRNRPITGTTGTTGTTGPRKALAPAYFY